LFADAGYSGTPLAAWLLALGGWVLDIVRGVVGQAGFQVEPKRWIIERTFGWLN
jgi:transposase